MSDFLRYQYEIERERAARNLRDYATAGLEVASIRKRLAEIKSQHEPLAGLLTRPLSERDRLYAAAFYVVVGRLPASPTIEGAVKP